MMMIAKEHTAEQKCDMVIIYKLGYNLANDLCEEQHSESAGTHSFPVTRNIIALPMPVLFGR